ncbi:hypothetical protein WMY93_014570 [Mugilogobius chulae]|uniref:Uncharacterized protein n=1 Tax=Mugilogobius chulae TaxID=88201 RepID=A0AAW0NUV2_9GOBI
MTDPSRQRVVSLYKSIYGGRAPWPAESSSKSGLFYQPSGKCAERGALRQWLIPKYMHAAFETPLRMTANLQLIENMDRVSCSLHLLLVSWSSTPNNLYVPLPSPVLQMWNLTLFEQPNLHHSI